MHLLRLAVEIEILDLDLGRTLDLLIVFRDRETAFLVDALRFRRPGDLRIDEDLRLLLVVLLGKVHGDDTDRLADLDRRQPDAGRVVHRLEHLFDQLADAVVDLRHRLGHLPKTLVGESDDFAQGHAPRCKGWRP
jgi:hypothetical protein